MWPLTASASARTDPLTALDVNPILHAVFIQTVLVDLVRAHQHDLVVLLRNEVDAQPVLQGSLVADQAAAVQPDLATVSLVEACRVE